MRPTTAAATTTAPASGYRRREPQRHAERWRRFLAGVRPGRLAGRLPGVDNSGATVNYDPVGSGTGRENFISKAFSFAGSDSALSTDEGELDAANERCGGDVIEVPAYVSPIAVIYNLPDVEGVQLDAATIAGIFDDKITKWNDPAIADQNPDLDLPDTTITPVHRSDDSGTTDNFTDYLSAGRPTAPGPTTPTASGRSRAARPPRAPRASWPR